jgi:hypothetical protein
VTSQPVCKRHRTPNRELVLHSMMLGSKTYICDECEAEIDNALFNHAIDAMVNRPRPKLGGESVRVPLHVQSEVA